MVSNCIKERGERMDEARESADEKQEWMRFTLSFHSH